MFIEYKDYIYIGVAMLLGLLIGAEREYRGKPAGLRTLMLVTVGACIFTILSLKIGTNNPDRIAANIITGIGFLGAGAIFKDENKINGLTTATTIWLSAAIGMAVGAGYILMAFVSAITIEIFLFLLRYIEYYIDDIHFINDYNIEIEYNHDVIEKIEQLFLNYKLKYLQNSHSKSENTLICNWKIVGKKTNHQLLVNYLLNDTNIKTLKF